MADIYLDSAAASLIQQEALEAGNAFVELYNHLTVSASDITIALRATLKDARETVATSIIAQIMK